MSEQMRKEFEVWHSEYFHGRNYSTEAIASAVRDHAWEIWQAALATQPQAPQGWKLVPIEPTEEMCQAALNCQDWDPKDTPEAEMYCLYQAMVAAAPETPEGAKP